MEGKGRKEVCVCVCMCEINGKSGGKKNVVINKRINTRYG